MMFPLSLNGPSDLPRESARVGLPKRKHALRSDSRKHSAAKQGSLSGLAQLAGGSDVLRSLFAGSYISEPGAGCGLPRPRRTRSRADGSSMRRFHPQCDRFEERTLLTTLLVTNISDSGPGSLRQAIIDNNVDTANTAADTIQFDSSLAGQVITLTSDLPEITHNLTISGLGADELAISGGGDIPPNFVDDGVLSIASNVTAQFSGLTIENGISGIVNSGTLTLSNSTVSDNISSECGIVNSGTLTLSNSLVSGNTGIRGGGIYNLGNNATLTISDSTLSGNSAGYGGAIYNSLGTAALSNCTISGNSTQFDGGGILNYDGTLALSDCTLSGNTSSYTSGGGISNVYGTAVLSNCTLSGNVVSPFAGNSRWGGGGGEGGAIYDILAHLTLVNCTISGNTAPLGGGIWENAAQLPLLRNTIVAGNFDVTPIGNDPTLPPDIHAVLDPSSANNLIGNGLGLFGISDGTQGNQVGTSASPIDPKLGALADNGGPTQTIALLPGSPAIDRGDDSVLGSPYSLTTDQRGFPREFGTHVDIGAYEVGPSYQITPTASQSDVQAIVNAAASSNGSVTLDTTSDAAVSTAVKAANAENPSSPVTVTLDLGGQTLTTDTHVATQPGVTLVITDGTLVGGSPALIVDSGNVVLVGVTALNATNAPTIVVNGGSLKVRQSTIQESTGFDQAAILVTGGTVDLGTASDPGGNTINVNGSGQWVRNTSGNPVSAVGTTFTVNGALAPSSLSGIVFSDFNNDGQVDFGEQGIAGVPINVTGTDDLGHAVNLSQTTDAAGTYVFLNLRPGTYTITETQQPAGYTPGIASVGTGGGTVSGAQFTVSLTAGLNAMNYNYGEEPAATGPVQKGQTAGIGFWNNKNGQALINALNGGATSTQLGNWLAATFPHMFGAASGSNDLAGENNAYVASFFQGRFVVHGQKLDAQVLATALAVYVTDGTLDNTGVGTQYGFLVGGNGVATATFNVGTNGAAFGVADNTTMTVMDLLLAADAQSVNGVLYNGNTTKRNLANNIFSAINAAGNI